MILLLMVMGHAAATQLPAWPKPPATAPDECSEAIPLSFASPISAQLIDESTLIRCSAACEPLSSYAHLLMIEKHAQTVRDLYVHDTQSLIAEREHWKKIAESKRPWYEKPWFVAVATSSLVASVAISVNSK